MEQADEMPAALAPAGDSDEFRALVERHSRTIFRLAYRMTGNEHDAEDVVQETFLRAYRRLPQFENRASLSTWLHRITVNCALDLLRSRQRHNTGHEPIDTVSPDGKLALPAKEPAPDRLLFSSEVQQQVTAALASLSPKEKVAFVLRHFEQKSIEEISRTMGLRSAAAKNNIFRAVKKLRKALEPLVSVER